MMTAMRQIRIAMATGLVVSCATPLLTAAWSLPRHRGSSVVRAEQLPWPVDSVNAGLLSFIASRATGFAIEQTTVVWFQTPAGIEPGDAAAQAEVAQQIDTIHEENNPTGDALEGLVLDEALLSSFPNTRHLVHVRVGWPFASMHGAATLAAGGKAVGRVLAFEWTPPRRGNDVLRVIPLMPILEGFVGNWLFWSFACWPLVAIVSSLRSRVRRVRGQCGGCGYLLTRGAPRCPECGMSAT